MTIRTWIVLGSAAAMIAGAGACKDNSGTAPRSSSGSSAAEGRRGENLPRARTDAGAGALGGSSGISGSESTSGSSSGVNAPNSPSSGTTPGGTGQSGSNASGTDTSNPGK